MAKRHANTYATINKSYICELQQEIYKDNRAKYPKFDSEYISQYSLGYRFKNNFKAITQEELKPMKQSFITPELTEDKNPLK